MPIKIIVEVTERKGRTIQIEMITKTSKTKPTHKEVLNGSILCAMIDMALRAHASSKEGVVAAFTPEDIDTLKGLKDLEENTGEDA